jgi:prepilin-type N-terminal cleavage/methylation domain-containing protein
MQPPVRSTVLGLATRSRCRASAEARCNQAFTLVELLLVVTIVGVLAALLMPALSNAKLKGKRLACLNNLRQLGLGFHLYVADNTGRLPANYPGDDPARVWVPGNMRADEDATNRVLLTRGRLFPYANHASLYHCPSDSSLRNGVARVRSYSMNGWLGSRYMERAEKPTDFRTFVLDNELAMIGPSRLWTLMDEHEASIDDSWFLVTMDDSRPFASFPATRHERGYGLSFADGHAESYAMRDPNSNWLGVLNHSLSARNTDWLRLKQVTTVR